MFKISSHNDKVTIVIDTNKNRFFFDLKADAQDGVEMHLECAHDIDQTQERATRDLRIADENINQHNDLSRDSENHFFISTLSHKIFESAQAELFPLINKIIDWTLYSRENVNYTYDLTDLNMAYLSSTVANVVGHDKAVIDAYIAEAIGDDFLASHIRQAIAGDPIRILADDTPRFARRLGWYALARVTKPSVIVETGVDKGLGSVLMCAALLRNREEGFPGAYFGTDINPKAGFLLSGIYSEVGKILYGDSIETLKKFDRTIDFFINDSDHSRDYEMMEYHLIKDLLSDRSIIIGDNSHQTDALLEFSRMVGRRFSFFREEPKNHWHRGGGIGISY